MVRINPGSMNSSLLSASSLMNAHRIHKHGNVSDKHSPQIMNNAQSLKSSANNNMNSGVCKDHEPKPIFWSLIGG